MSRCCCPSLTLSEFPVTHLMGSGKAPSNYSMTLVNLIQTIHPFNNSTMEYQQCRYDNAPDSHFLGCNTHNGIARSRVPVSVRLHLNKEQKLLIENQREKKKQEIVIRRKEKENNAQRILKQKWEANENAKCILRDIQKNRTTVDVAGWKKTDDINMKIKECRERADGLRTVYTMRLLEQRRRKEKQVKEKRMEEDKERSERQLNYCIDEQCAFMQWKVENSTEQLEYVSSIKDYKGASKQERQLRDITKKFNKLKINGATKNRSVAKTVEREGSNPIYWIVDPSWFGIGKSIGDPQKMAKEMQQFLKEHKMAVELAPNETLLDKFEKHLREETGQQ